MHDKQLIIREIAITLAAILSATVVTLSFPFLRGEGMYFLYLTAIVCSSLFGSFRAGIVATALSLTLCLLIAFYFKQSPYPLMEWLVFIAFALAASLTVFLCYVRQIAEKARLRAENRYRVLFEDIITGIYETTLDGRYAKANPKLAEMFGYDSAQKLIYEAADLNEKFYVLPDRRAEFISLIHEQGSLAGFESEIYRRDGSRIWISENALAVRDEQGRLTGFQGTTIEITDRKRAEAELKKAHEELEEKVAARTAELQKANEILREEVAERKRIEKELRRSEEKFRALVEISSETIWEVDETLKYTYISPKSREFNGYEPEEMVGKLPYFMMPPEETQRVAPIFEQIIRSREPFRFLEVLFITKNGEIVVSEISGVPLFEDSGRFHGYRGVVRNITERKRIENELRRSEEKFRALVEMSSELIWETDERGNYTYISPKSRELNGYEPHEIIGKKAFMFMTKVEAERVSKILKSISHNKETFNFLETITIEKSGKIAISETSGVPFFDDDGNFRGYRGVARDITQRKRFENDLIESQKRLRALSAHLQSVREEERKKIARELHDELGQILTALKIDVVRLSEKFSGIKHRTAFLMLKEQFPQMLLIIDEAMDLTRRIVAELRPGVLDELGLAAAIEWQALEFQKRTGINCVLKIEFSENSTCINHKTAVFRIFQECLTNVARHSGATDLQISLRSEQSGLFLEVEDNGCGITELDMRDPHKFGVLGMRERALLLDGNFEISRISETGGGTRVKVSIPCPLEGAS